MSRPVVEASGIRLGRRPRAALDDLLLRSTAEPPNYDHIGSTLQAGAVPGVPDRCFSCEVDGDLATASATLRAWAPHRGIAGRIHPPDAPLTVGTTLLVVAPCGPFEMAVPDRVIAVVDEPDRFGFAYGALPGHAEMGEEAFVAEVIGPDRLRLTVRVHARPATRLARLGSPVVTVVQGVAARRYLAAWSSAIRGVR